jgi:hypothetical protein
VSLPVDIRFIAKQYIDAGWAVVPLVKGEKRASSSWQKKVYAPADFGSDDGIAGKCGEPSGWRVDVDCDAPEAIEAAKIFLPNTGLIHGRPGKPDSHYWYRCEGVKTTQFTDVKSKSSSMLIEIRSTGGYTALPPSVHPSGDELAWTVERDALQIAPDDLSAAVRLTAISAALARHWPGAGARHAAMGPLAGFLLQAKIDPMFVLKIIETSARIAGDQDVHDRLNFARATIAAFTAGQNVTGGPKLADAIGEDLVSKLRGWLKMVDVDAIEEMNTKHFIIRIGKDELIGTEDDGDVFFQYSKALALRYANRKVVVGVDGKGNEEFKPLYQAWLESKTRRDYRTIVFCPPPLTCQATDYNLWKGFAITPVAGDCQLFLDHVRDVICSGNAAHYEYMMNLLALTIQEPGVPSEVAVVLKGEAGTGKGIFVRSIGDLFGRHYAHLDKVDQLVGHFNSLLSAKVIVFADEAFWAGDKRELGALKRLITEPTLTIERKGIDATQEKNCVHLFMATNEEWAFPAMLKERRAFVLHVSSKRRGDFEYFGKLAAHLKDGGLAALLDLLLKFKVDRELLRHVPRTKELRAQQGQSLTPVLEWWQDCLYEGTIGNLGWQSGMWLPASQVYDVYKAWSTDRHLRVLSNIEFGRRMGDFIGSEPSKGRKINGNVVRCLKLRDLDDARKWFDGELGSVTDWQVANGPVTSTPQANPF